MVRNWSVRLIAILNREGKQTCRENCQSKDLSRKLGFHSQVYMLPRLPLLSKILISLTKDFVDLSKKNQLCANYTCFAHENFGQLGAKRNFLHCCHPHLAKRANFLLLSPQYLGHGPLVAFWQDPISPNYLSYFLYFLPKRRSLELFPWMKKLFLALKKKTNSKWVN